MAKPKGASKKYVSAMSKNEMRKQIVLASDKDQAVKSVWWMPWH
jgi:hypothetical protein